MNYNGIVLLVDNPAFQRKETYNLPVCGKQLKEWAALGLDTDSILFVDYDEQTNLLTELKSRVDPSREFSVVLFSDAPLVKRATINGAVKTLSDKKGDFLRLSRGYIFRTAFLLTCTELPRTKAHICGTDDFLVASDFAQLSVISAALQNRIIRFHQDNGVYFIDSATAYVDADVVIGSGVTIHPNNTLRGKTVVEGGAILLGGNTVTNSVIGAGAEIFCSVITESVVGARSHVGPYAYLRPDSKIGAECRIGDFVETKKAKIGDKTKISHLSYVGDAEVGSGCNIGCGVVFANYDGKNKARTIVGNRVFIGSNSNLIAPLVLENGAYIAAGSTLTDDVPAGALAIARARQVVKPDWNNGKF